MTFYLVLMTLTFKILSGLHFGNRKGKEVDISWNYFFWGVGGHHHDLTLPKVTLTFKFFSVLYLGKYKMLEVDS